MATELISRTWCDMCLGELDQRTEATHSDPVSIGAPRRTLDLCQTHYDNLLAPVVEALKRYGNPMDPKATPAPQAPTEATRGRPRHPVPPCPQCGYRANSRSSLRVHLLNVHEMDPVTASRAMGGTLPCPDCGYLALDGTGLAVHRRSAHPGAMEAEAEAPPPKSQRRKPAA